MEHHKNGFPFGYTSGDREFPRLTPINGQSLYLRPDGEAAKGRDGDHSRPLLTGVTLRSGSMNPKESERRR